MDQGRWLDFLARRLRSQISLETAARAETWALALLGLTSLGGALAGVSSERGPIFFASLKILFVILFYATLLFGVHLPNFLQRGERPVARLLGILDFTSLAAISLIVTWVAFVVFGLSHGLALGAEELGASRYLGFVLWFNDAVALVHVLACVFFIVSFFGFPRLVARWVEYSAKVRYPVFGTHLTLLVLLAFGYGEWTPVGSPDFFEQFRVAGLFWLFVGGALVWIGRVLRHGSVPGLAFVELECVSGRLEHTEDILARYKEAFVSRRLAGWIHRLSQLLANETEKIARNCHEAIALVSRESPSEVDLNQVEERHRRAEALQRRLERENQRFLLCAWLFDLNETERAKLQELRDQFSRELRNTKIEVASVRRRIDERLVSLKQRDFGSLSAAPLEESPVLESPSSQTTSSPL